MTDYPPLPFKGSDIPSDERYEATIKELNDRLIDRTQGLLATASKHRKGRSATSFRAGFIAGMNFCAGPNNPGLEQALQQHLES